MQLTDAASRALLIGATAVSVIVDGVDIDGGGNAGSGVEIDTGLSSFALLSSNIRDTNIVGMWQKACTNITVDECNFSGIQGAAYNFVIGSGLNRLRNSKFEYPSPGASVKLIEGSDSKTGGFFESFGNSVNLSAGLTSYALYLTKCNADIVGCDIQCRGSVTSRAIYIINSGVLPVTRLNISANNINNYNNPGYGIGVGDDSYPASPNTISNVMVVCNIIANANHGLLLGAITGATARLNYFFNCLYGVVDKNTIESVVEYNDNFKPTTGSGGILAKGSTSSKYNNNCYYNDVVYPIPGLTMSVSEISRNTTAAEFKVNIIYSVNDIIFVNGQAGCEGVFENNIYFSAAGGGSWVYNGVTYNSIEEWNALANVTNDRYLDPKFIDGPNGDLRLRYDSPLVDLGLADVGCYPGNYTE